MKKILDNKHHFLSVLIFLVISFGYFTALLEGKEIEPHDTKTWKGISKEVRDFRAENDEELYGQIGCLVECQHILSACHTSQTWLDM